MNVLFLTPYIGSIYGGIGKAVLELAQKLGSIGVQVDLVTTNANGSNKLNIPLQTWISNNGCRMQYFPCWNQDDLIVSPSLTKWLFSRLADYDLVHTQTNFSPLVSLTHILCRLYKIPYIATPHGMLEPWALSYKAWKKKLYFNLLEKPALSNASAIQVLSTSEANNVQSLGLSDSVIVPNGIRTEEFKSLQEPELFYQQFPHTKDKNLILFLGRIDPKKGLDLLAPAFGKVYSHYPNSHLIVAGPDNTGFLPTVQSYFQQAECLEAVTFTGMLTGSLKQAAFAAANIYVAPSYSEGFSMSILEGMASGLPCIFTNTCNFPEAAENQIAWVVDIDVNAITNALFECLNNPQVAKAKGDRARQFILQNYTWEKSAQKLVKVYKNTLDDSKF